MLTQLYHPCASCTCVRRTRVGSIPSGTTGIISNSCSNSYGDKLTNVDHLLGAGSTPPASQTFFINNINKDNVLNIPPTGICGPPTSALYPHAIIPSAHPETDYADAANLWGSLCSLAAVYADGSGQVRIIHDVG